MEFCGTVGDDALFCAFRRRNVASSGPSRGEEAFQGLACRRSCRACGRCTALLGLRLWRNSPSHDYPGCGHMGVLPLQHATCITRRDDGQCAALAAVGYCPAYALAWSGSDGRNCAHHPHRLSCQHVGARAGQCRRCRPVSGGKHYRRAIRGRGVHSHVARLLSPPVGRDIRQCPHDRHRQPTV